MSNYYVSENKFHCSSYPQEENALKMLFHFTCENLGMISRNYAAEVAYGTLCKFGGEKPL